MKVTRFWFRNRDKELHLAVKPYENGCRCPECGRRGRIVRHTTVLHRWEDLTPMGMKIRLCYAPKDIQCPTHGRVQDAIPWAPTYSRITYRLEWRICALCQIMTQKAAAEILKMPPSTLSDCCTGPSRGCATDIKSAAWSPSAFLPTCMTSSPP
jgi:transposase